jgi:hypothetical protein
MGFSRAGMEAAPTWVRLAGVLASLIVVTMFVP